MSIYDALRMLIEPVNHQLTVLHDEDDLGDYERTHVFEAMTLVDQLLIQLQYAELACSEDR